MLDESYQEYIICLNKQEIKDAIAYLFFNCFIWLLFLISSARLLVLLWVLIKLFFFPTHSYIIMKVSGWTKTKKEEWPNKSEKTL